MPNTKGFQTIQTDNSLPLKGSTSGYVTVAPPATVTDYTITLPSVQGAANEVMVNDGTGLMTWTAAAAGNVAGPVSSTNRSIATWNGVGGSALFDNPGVAISVAGNIQLTGTSTYRQVISDTAAASGFVNYNNWSLSLTDNGANSTATTRMNIITTDFGFGWTHNAGVLQNFQVDTNCQIPTGHTAIATTGITSRMQHPGAGSTGQMVAFAASMVMNANGSAVTDYIGFYVEPSGVINGTLTNFYGLYIDDLTPGGGTSTNRYGVVVEKASTAGLWLKNGSKSLMDGSTSGTLTFAVPAAVTSHTLTWPAAQGASGSVLTNNGSGTLSWGGAFTGAIGNNLFTETYSATAPAAGINNMNNFDMTFTNPGAPITATINGLIVKESFGASWVAGGGDFVGVLSNVVSSLAGGFTTSSETGFKASLQSSGASTITTVRGYEAVGSFTNASNVVTTYEAYHVSAPSTSGTITNAYGLYVDNLTTGTNNYGIYIAGASTQAIWVDSGDVRFDGNVLANGGAFTVVDTAGNLASANGANFGPGLATSITVVAGIVTAIS